MNDRGLHTDHRAIVAIAATVFLGLTLIIAVLPALREQGTPALAAAHPRSVEEERGRRIYLKEGCGFCHTQFVRDLLIDRPFGRASEAGDYAAEDPPLLGTQRTGPDLANVGARQPSDTWHLLHLYDPRAVVPQSVMPGYRWYFEEKAQAGPGDVVIPVPVAAAPAGKVVVARPEALALVRYLLSLRQVQVSP